MKLHFKPSEFNISGEPIPEDVADKIQEYHIIPLQKVRDTHGQPIYVSKNSGYRSPEWEKSKGRSGNSQHTFKGNGAVDLTSDDLDRLQQDLIEHSPYKRICRYNSFIHCDYKGNERILYKYDNGWKRVKSLD
jgi:hypothetical protein